MKKTPFDSKNNLYIFSDPRGGGTWLMQILQSVKNGAVVWEPLHMKHGLVPKSLKLTNVAITRCYIPEDEEWNEFKGVLTAILTGRKINSHSISASPTKYLTNKFFLVKFIRANAILPWMIRNFEFDHLPVHLIRHPVSTALSQLKTFHQGKDFGKMQIPDVRYPQLYQKHADFLKTLTLPIEQFVATWCLHNAELMSDRRQGHSWITIYYEDLIVHPEKTLEYLFKKLNLPLPDNAMEMVRKKSRTDFHGDFSDDPMVQLSKWKSRVSKEDLVKVNRILKHFGIECYSVEEVMPIKKND